MNHFCGDPEGTGEGHHPPVRISPGIHQCGGLERHLGLGTLKRAGELLLGMKGSLQPAEPDRSGPGDRHRGLRVRTHPVLGGHETGAHLHPGTERHARSHQQDPVPVRGRGVPGRTRRGAGISPPTPKRLFTGNPVRREILEATREEGLKKFGLDPDKTTLLASGRAGGHGPSTRPWWRWNSSWPGIPGSRSSTPPVPWAMKSMRKPWGIRCSMPGTFMWCPISTICPWPWRRRTWRFSRAGAIGLAELMVKGIPSILVPYPYATANHQEYNARALAAKGAAIVALDKDLTGDWLLGEVGKTAPGTRTAGNHAPERSPVRHAPGSRCHRRRGPGTGRTEQIGGRDHWLIWIKSKTYISSASAERA